MGTVLNNADKEKGYCWVIQGFGRDIVGSCIDREGTLLGDLELENGHRWTMQR